MYKKELKFSVRVFGLGAVGLALSSGCGKLDSANLQSCDDYLKGSMQVGRAYEQDLKLIKTTKDQEQCLAIAIRIQERLRVYLTDLPKDRVACRLSSGQASTFEISDEERAHAARILAMSPKEFLQSL